MTRALPSPVVCDRFHAQISLELDGELSQLERAMLEAHLSRCAGCAAFRTEATAIAEAVRCARLERLSAPIVVRRTARLITARLQAAAAAAMALAVVGVSSQIASNRPSPGDAPALTLRSSAPVVRFPTQAELERELALIHSPRALELPKAGKPTAR